MLASYLARRVETKGTLIQPNSQQLDSFLQVSVQSRDGDATLAEVISGEREQRKKPAQSTEGLELEKRKRRRDMMQR